MERYLLKDHWAQLVTEFKDSERETHMHDGYATEQLSVEILDYLRTRRFRQWTLLVQKRGEEFEQMMATMETRGHNPEAIKRFLDTDDLWTVTVELATQ
jgi:hypothetical protein